MSAALPWEDAVLDEVRRLGWSACSYGQGLLSSEVRNALKGARTPLRWEPDILAVLNGRIVGVEAKTGRDDTPNHIIEKDSLDALQAWAEYAGTYVVVVWPGFYSATTKRILRGPCEDMPYRGTGSGTRAWLFPKSASNPLRDILNALVQVAA